MGALALLGAAVGIVAMFAMLGLTVMALAELIQGRAGLRGRNLARVLEQMVGAEALDRLMKSSYLRSLTDPREPTRMPSYLPPEAVADAILELATGTAGSRRDWRDRIAEAGASALTAAPLAAREVLLGQLRESRNLDELHRRVQGWFNDINARSQGWYRRRLNKLLLLISVTLAVLINADTFQMMSALTQDPGLRVAALEQAEQVVDDLQTQGLTREQRQLAIEQMCPSLVGRPGHVTQQTLIGCVAGFPVPFLGWGEDPLYQGLDGDYPMTPGEWLWRALYKLAGLVVAASTMTLAATLWFDLLKRLVNLRATLPVPLPRTQGRAGRADAPQTRVEAEAQQAVPPAPIAATAVAAAASSGERRQVHGLSGFAPEALEMDLVNAEWMASLSAMAYQTHEAVFERFMAKAQLQVEFFDGGATVAVAASAPLGRAGIEVRTVDTNGYVAWNEHDCFIVFNGAQQEFPGWFLDARMRRIDQLLEEQPMRVHEGLHAALSAVWRAGFSGPLPEVLTRFDSGRRRLWLTGHGLGGALAQMAAVALDEALARPGNRHAAHWAGIRGVYSFGAPRIGDGSFVGAIEERCSRRIFRFVNGRDVVPRSPPVSQGYRHAGQLFYFDGMGQLKRDAPDWLLSQGPQEANLGLLRELAPDRVDDHGIGQYRRRLQATLRGEGLTPGTDPLF